MTYLASNPIKEIKPLSGKDANKFARKMLAKEKAEISRMGRRIIDVSSMDYLNKEFPKGHSEKRGEAMVLIALARYEGRKDRDTQIKEVIKWLKKLSQSNYYNVAWIDETIRKLKGLGK